VKPSVLDTKDAVCAPAKNNKKERMRGEDEGGRVKEERCEGEDRQRSTYSYMECRRVTGCSCSSSSSHTTSPLSRAPLDNIKKNINERNKSYFKINK
jgi:hypothetical protein